MNSTLNSHKLYDRDFVEWCKMTASQLKDINFENLDLKNLIEEIERLAKRDKRELKNRFFYLKRIGRKSEPI